MGSLLKAIRALGHALLYCLLSHVAGALYDLTVVGGGCQTVPAHTCSCAYVATSVRRRLWLKIDTDTFIALLANKRHQLPAIATCNLLGSGAHRSIQLLTTLLQWCDLDRTYYF